MHLNYHREIAASACLVLFGLFFATYALAFLEIGTFSRLGPGMFPLIIGLIIMTLGLLHGIVTLTSREAPGATTAETTPVEAVQWQSLGVVVGAIVAFSIAVDFFGIVPGIFVLTAVASFGSRHLTPVVVLVAASVLSLMAWAIFILALGLPFTMFEWPL